MSTITYTTEFDAPPGVLWPWLVEPEKQKEWMHGLIENKQMDDGPVGVGTSFQMHIQEGRRVVVYDGTMTAYEPNRHVGIRITGDAMKGTIIQTDYRLTDLGGRTRLYYTATPDTSDASFFMKLLTPVFMLFGKMQVKRFLATLKECVKTESSPSPAAA